MDNLRGTFESGDLASDSQGWDAHEDEDEVVRDLPPEAIGQDERRMQVRAYNHWASLLGDRSFPSIEDLEPHNLPDFGPNSVLLDFSGGIEDPAVQYLGGELAEECGAQGHIAQLSDVPPRSLLSRITDHYMQILANQAPIGFEAEFVNQRGASIMYRGILLPFSSDDETIDFIYGVINWKEIADQVTADELLLEIDQALDGEDDADIAEDEPHKHHSDPVTDWADAPAAETGEDAAELLSDIEDADHIEEAADTEGAILDLEVEAEFEENSNDDNVASLGGIFGGSADDSDLPMPDFGQYGLDDPEDEEEDDTGAGYSFASLTDFIETPTKKAIDLDAEEFDPADYQVENADEDPVIEEPDDVLDPVDSQPVSEHDWRSDAEPADSDESAEADWDEIRAQIAPETSHETESVADATDAAGDGVCEGDAEDSDAGENHIDEGSPETPIIQLTPPEPSAPQPAMVEHSDSQLGEDAGLHDFLASARELANEARISEDRSRTALYAAVGRAYDFSLAAKGAPQEYRELIEENGLTYQDRAPMTPVVKLVFGSDYDKTRLTEYAAVLAHAHRLELARGTLAAFLEKTEGGLKGMVASERRMRREETGKTVEPEDEIRRALAEKLRELQELTLEAISRDGPEFSLVMVRRDGNGGLSVVGEIDEDIRLIERAAKKLVG
ncbi:hypothetical protein [Erythrobacter sp. MTPC3]|uniref:hypothetical protein n=1 Tax=Erythrobacter sp. MTPC3 TaxID=3056564 RepID=UPI0036F38A05